jgi:hypothetical protein
VVSGKSALHLPDFDVNKVNGTRWSIGLLWWPAPICWTLRAADDACGLCNVLEDFASTLVELGYEQELDTVDHAGGVFVGFADVVYDELLFV